MQNTTQQLIEALRARQGGATDYRIAKNMGWTPQVLSKYRHGRSQLDNRGLLQVAAALELSAVDVVRYMAQIESERAHTDDQRATWAELCRQWGGHAAAFALVVLAGIAPAPADAAQHSAYLTRCNLLNLTVSRSARACTGAALAFLLHFFASFFSNPKHRNISHRNGTPETTTAGALPKECTGRLLTA